MVGKRKDPKLRFNGTYYVANIYKPDGKRTMISFGPGGDRTEGEIMQHFFCKFSFLLNQQIRLRSPFPRSYPNIFYQQPSLR